MAVSSWGILSTTPQTRQVLKNIQCVKARSYTISTRKISDHLLAIELSRGSPARTYSYLDPAPDLYRLLHYSWKFPKTYFPFRLPAKSSRWLTDAFSDAQSALSISSGLLFANPIAVEHSIAKVKMDAIIAQAIREAEGQGASGSDNTPFILRRIREVTGGQTVTANRALIEANVIRGTKVAVELAKLERRDHGVLAW